MKYYSTQLYSHEINLIRYINTISGSTQIKAYLGALLLSRTSCYHPVWTQLKDCMGCGAERELMLGGKTRSTIFWRRVVAGWGAEEGQCKELLGAEVLRIAIFSDCMYV